MWKKAMMGITAMAAALTMSACGGASAGNGSSASAAAVPEGKSIVLYYSATGNTKKARLPSRLCAAPDAVAWPAASIGKNA